jgi:aspartate-semialdehyde dehydrogenase
VPEENGIRAAEYQGIVANPNWRAIPLTCALKPLHDAAGIEGSGATLEIHPP